jgi:hypothetical protein
VSTGSKVAQPQADMTVRSKPPADIPSFLRGPPPPLHGGPLVLLRFMRANNMLSLPYAHLLARLALLKLRHGRRLRTDGL